MRRIGINLFALLVIGVGGSYLSGVDAAQAGPAPGYTSCTGGSCVCTSGDGKVTCQGYSCIATATSCAARPVE